jgi:hypothetical protein
LVSYDSEKKSDYLPKSINIFPLYTVAVNTCTVKEEEKILHYEEEPWAAKN